MRNIGIIGGSGVYSPEVFAGFEEKIIATPYGEALCFIGKKYGNNVVFLTRHGVNHSVPPHKINYRANIWALKKLGVEEIVATSAVGSLNLEMGAGDFVICDQLLDFTKSRIYTFYDTPERGVAHVDFSNPYCETLRQKLVLILNKLSFPCHSNGTMVVTEGPRFETPAEIKAYRMMGADVVNMTNSPECVLAREAEMHYATIAVVTNLSAGISKHPLSNTEVQEKMKISVARLNKIFDNYLADNILPEKLCNCENAMAETGGFKL